MLMLKIIKYENDLQLNTTINSGPMAQWVDIVTRDIGGPEFEPQVDTAWL